MSADMDNRISQLTRALDPDSIKVDGRNNRDRLAFVTAFSSLILYYDQNNQLAGDWHAFFMKDPTILLSAISKTDYHRYHEEFMLLEQGKTQFPPGAVDFVFVNQLCQLLQNMFATMNRWFYFMELNASVNNLYLFLKKKIEETLSSQLSLLIALQRRLSSVTSGAVTEPDIMLYRSFEPVWQSRSHKHLRLSSNLNTILQPYIAALNRIYHVVFDVFVQIIDYATQAFYQQENQPTKYPDTALLMTFSRLMEVQQKEINLFSSKHLDFYYDRILLQSLRPEQSDQVVVCLALADKIDSLSLPSGTQFKAGVYPDQSEILFGSNAELEINRAAIASVNTLYYEAKPDPAGLYLEAIDKPTQVSRNSLQEIITWDGFGGTKGLRIQQGFALASPMLFLQGGVRRITIDFTFANKLSNTAALLKSRQCYLSTKKGWLPVPKRALVQGGSANSIQILLQPSDPAIVPFAKGPDGFSSIWPMFKMMLDHSVDLTAPPIIKQINIEVQVDQFSHFSLANDISQLPNTGPQQIFGPVPELGSCFYVGSNECFAKPLSLLTLTMNWDNLPADFSDYYAPYNLYLFTQLIATIKMVATAAKNAAINAGKAAKTLKTATKGTPAAIVAASVVKAAASAVTTAVTAEKAVGKAEKKLNKAAPETATTEMIAAITAVLTAADAAESSAESAAAAATVAAGTKAETAAKTAETATLAAKAAAIATVSKVAAFNNTAFMGQWKLLTQKNWQALKIKCPERPVLHLPPSSPFVPSFWRKILQWFSQPILQPTPIVTPVKSSHFFVGLVSLFQQFVNTHKQNTEIKSSGKENTKKNCPNSIFTFNFDDKSTDTLTPDLAMSALPPIKLASDGYLRFELQKPDYAFGHSLYAKLVSQISLCNARILIHKSSHTKIQTMPNLPYTPKQTSLLASYTASSKTVIENNLSTGTGTNKPYPLELYHYGSFKPYLAYDAVVPEKSNGFANLTPRDPDTNQTPTTHTAQLPLFTGVSGKGCMYIALKGVVAPCRLTLFAEINAAEKQVAQDNESIGYYSWTNTGWEPITVLQNDTNNLSCSGIIKFEIPQVVSHLTPAERLLTPIQQDRIKQDEKKLSYLPSPIMPNTDFWLAIATKRKGVNFRLSYLNTQAVKLNRVSTAALPLGETPQIAANTIIATQNKIAHISSIVQPFPSCGGLPAENKSSYGGFNSFYRRVSTRLNNKDRSVSSTDFVDMAHAVCINLYYARTLTDKPGLVRIGLVNGYANAQLPNAFRPVVSGIDQATIHKHLAARTSTMTKLSVFNLKHQIVKISVTLSIAPDATANMETIKLAINQQLKMYLSPWICSDFPQRNMTADIDRASLIQFLAAQKDVSTVLKLRAQGDCLQDDETILVSTMQHAITLVPANGGQA